MNQKYQYIFLFSVLGAVIIFAVVGTRMGNEEDMSVTANATQEVEEAETVAPEVRTYVISANSTYLAGQRAFTVAGSSDLPDGSVLNLRIRDEDYFSYDDKHIDWRSENLTYITDNAVVSDGRFAKTVIASVYEAPLKSDEYTIEVSFNPRYRSQPSDVVKMVGENGEYLAGDLVNKTVAGLSTLVATNNINIKSPNAAGAQDWDSDKARQICTDNSSWTKVECESLAKGNIWLGMHYDMLIFLFGKEDLASPSNFGSGVRWQWCWYDVSPSCFYADEDKIIDSYN